jgi:hypothetical protein
MAVRDIATGAIKLTKNPYQLVWKRNIATLPVVREGRSAATLRGGIDNFRIGKSSMSFSMFSKAAVVGAALFTAQSVSAATFDFIAMADGPDANYIGPVELNWQQTAFAAGLTIDGVTLVASGSNANGGFADAFFDKDKAGLGVCSTPNIASGSKAGWSGCATGAGAGSNTADDNVSATQGGETLTLDFGQTVTVSQIIFTGEGHKWFEGSVKINGVTYDMGTYGTNVGPNVKGGYTTFAEALTGSVFDFEYIPVAGTSRVNQFYIGAATVAPIPVPAAGLLLLTALGGLGVARRRRKAA